MRLRNLIIGDVRFQVKYGFYFVYAVFTLFYICLIFAFPENIREKVGSVMIYSDPAAMGLYFMGAILLLEKSQRVLNSIAVSPVKVAEYILSKVISLGVIGTLVGVILSMAAGYKSGSGSHLPGLDRIILLILGIFLGSVMFSLLGLIVAVKTNSLNQFMIGTVPIELLCFIPPMLYLFGYRKSWMLLHPGCIIIRMIHGEGGFEPVLLLLLCLWIVLIYWITKGIVEKMFQNAGGFKL